MKRLLVFVLLLVGCTGHGDRFGEFEAEYEPTMQALTALISESEQSNNVGSEDLIAKCKFVSEGIKKRSLIMQEKANALTDKEARKVSSSVASSISEVGKAVEELGATYEIERMKADGVVVPGEGRYARIYDDIFKRGSIRELMSKIESEHAALKGVMARK